MDDSSLAELGRQMASVGGVVAVVLGGSRARGTHRPDSDGEVALCRILADPTGELVALQAQTRRYPAALGDALVRGLWEADFLLAHGARYGAAGADPTFAAGCLFRVIGIACHTLHGYGRQWLTHEKGMVASAARLPQAPPRFAERAQSILAAVGASPPEIEDTVTRAAALIGEVRAATEPPA